MWQWREVKKDCHDDDDDDDFLGFKRLYNYVTLISRSFPKAEFTFGLQCVCLYPIISEVTIQFSYRFIGFIASTFNNR